jgi:tryptophanyl-tRNA synthetase
MSKSAPDVQSRILLTDTPSEIKAKIRGAVTDSIQGVTYDPVNRPGASNLLTILAACANEDVETVATRYESKGHGTLKADVGEAVIELLRKPQEEFARLREERVYLVQVAIEGANKAKELSNETMRHVKQQLGLC